MTIGLHGIAFKFIITILVYNKLELVIFPEPISQRSRNLLIILTDVLCHIAFDQLPLFAIEELLVSPLG